MTQSSQAGPPADRMGHAAARDAATDAFQAVVSREISPAPVRAVDLWRHACASTVSSLTVVRAIRDDPIMRTLYRNMVASRAVARSGLMKAAAGGTGTLRRLGNITIELREGEGGLPGVLVIDGFGDRAPGRLVIEGAADVAEVALSAPLDGRVQALLPPGDPEAERAFALFVHPDAEVFLL
jgi:hypothetical protein